jgi:hypothetical protein
VLIGLQQKKRWGEKKFLDELLGLSQPNTSQLSMKLNRLDLCGWITTTMKNVVNNLLLNLADCKICNSIIENMRWRNSFCTSNK